MTPQPQRPAGRRSTSAVGAVGGAALSDFPAARRDPWKDTKFAISSRYSPVARRMLENRGPAGMRRCVSVSAGSDCTGAAGRINFGADCLEGEVQSAPASPRIPKHPGSPPLSSQLQPIETPVAVPNSTPIISRQGTPPDLVADDVMQGLQRSGSSTSSGASSASAYNVSALNKFGAYKTYVAEEEQSPGPGPSTPEEKLAMFRGCLTRILSCVYAVFIVTLGAVFYTSSLFSGKSPVLAEAFSIYLVLVGLAYFVFLYTDIRRYLSCMQRRHNYMLNITDRALLKPSMPGDIVVLPNGTTASTLPHHYCFSSASHVGSFYLKIGAAGFCFGHLVHSSLLLAQQVALFVADPEEFHNCATAATLLLDVLYPVYSFVQLFFIFKYSNVIINRGKEVARFAVMHCLATSLCFWLYAIMRETVDSLAHHADDSDDVMNDYEDHTDGPGLYGLSTVPPLASSTGAASTPLITSTPTMLASLFIRAEPVSALPLVAEPTSTLNAELTRVFNASGECRGVGQLSSVLDSLAPYLYPFTIEYSIVVVGILFIIWQNIGTCSNNQSSSSGVNPTEYGNGSRNGSTHGSTASLCRPPPMTPQSGFVSNVVVHADCHSANKGLFAGLIVLVGSAISIILFLLAMADSEYVDVGLTVNAVTELALLVLMTAAVSLAYGRLVTLDVIKGPSNNALLDDLLLFLCIPAFFLYAILSVGPSIRTHRYLTLATVLLQIIQVLLQTPFIMDGLRRCSNTQALRLRKPGRELVTFLIVCNLALWITDTFEIRSQEARDPRTHFYGRVPWTAISHATVPLTMLYRFHSSGCLVHIWKAAYEPAPM